MANVEFHVVEEWASRYKAVRGHLEALSAGPEAQKLAPLVAAILTLVDRLRPEPN